MAENRFEGSSDSSRQYTRTTVNDVSAIGHDDQNGFGLDWWLVPPTAVLIPDSLEILHLQSVLIFSVLTIKFLRFIRTFLVLVTLAINW